MIQNVGHVLLSLFQSLADEPFRMKIDFHRLVRVKKDAEIYKRYETKRVIQITAEATGDLIGNKISDKKITTVELQKLQIIHNKIIQGQLQVKMIKKYLKKDTYIQKKDKRFLIILVLK